VIPVSTDPRDFYAVNIDSLKSITVSGNGRWLELFERQLHPHSQRPVTAPHCRLQFRWWQESVSVRFEPIVTDAAERSDASTAGTGHSLQLRSLGSMKEEADIQHKIHAQSQRTAATSPIMSDAALWINDR
jgi:hypothetical protein